MLSMSFPEDPRERRALVIAIVASLLVHAGVIFFPRPEPPAGRPPAQRLEASLAPRSETAAIPPAPQVAPRPPTPSAKAASKPPTRSRLLTAEKSRGPKVAPAPKFSAADKAEMNRFLDELAGDARTAPPPSLAQRALAMARESARQQARSDEEGSVTLERRPDSPPPDPFSLEHYLDGLVKRLNRSAGYVRNDPRNRGLQAAAVHFRLNPDGSLKSFKVLNAGDQKDEIAYVKAVVERAIPFAAFPPDLDRAARSLGITICILPARGGDGFGFSRMGDGRGCS
ncbi:MAG TPA: hypothetical protein P5305_19155 [Rubrivivax sp.]|nr:hypothetical protein [Rubrivivax sp.]HRY90007.1 hypothetical protein [Rubrivivax sp.]